jgi:hypothetical protein
MLVLTPKPIQMALGQLYNQQPEQELPSMWPSGEGSSCSRRIKCRNKSLIQENNETTSSTIVLLPNIQEVVNIKQYQPICLLNVFYKIFTKGVICNTTCYGSPNLSLITVISGLVMHDTTK